MYEEIIHELKKQINEKKFRNIKSKTLHLGIFKGSYLDYIMDGSKTIESRFTKNKVAPYNKITKDDIIIIKKSGGDVIGYMTIKNILFFDLRKTSIYDIKNKYQVSIKVSDKFWIDKKNSRYATLIFINKVYKVKPFHINKKGMQTWIILNENEK